MKTDCEQFGELISGLIDGELTVPETEQITLHLKQCDDCRKTRAQFELVDRAIQSPGSALPFPGEDHRPSPLKRKPFRKSSNNSLLNRRFWMPFSITSAALVMLGLMIFWPAEPVEADTTTINIPNVELDKLEELNRDTQRNSDATLDTMKLQLRIMRVEAKRLDPEDAVEAELQAEIERLLTAVSELQNQ